jgi:hypothetical protein
MDQGLRITYLHNLGHTIRELPRRESLKEGSIDEDVFRLPKRANQVFAVGRIDSSLASDARIDHGEQGSRDLAKLDTSHTAK